DIGSFPDDSLECLTTLDRLRYLSIVHLPHIDDLARISRLKALTVLRLHTLPSWDTSGKTTSVASLTPLSDLPALRHLELFGVVPHDRSLAALQDCTWLHSVRVTKYPEAE